MTLTVVSMPELPDEPPERSVVLDREGRAWQHIGGMWLKVGVTQPLIGLDRTGAKNWLNLLADAGALTIVYHHSEPS